MLSDLKPVVCAALIGIACAAISACGGFGVTDITNPGNTPNVTAQTAFRIVGTIGTPFVARISDTNASYNVTGVVPLTIMMVNPHFPARMIAVKTANDSTLLTAEVLRGLTITAASSTTEAYGNTVVAVDTLPAFAPVANPDIRFFVKGPNKAIYNALIEDQGSFGYTLQQRVPTLILFESPTGRVDGIFNLVNYFGPFEIDLIVNGIVTQTSNGEPNATLKFP